MAGKIIISKEYKEHPSGLYRVKRVRCGAQFYGEIREYKKRDAAGKPIRIYWAARLKGEYIQQRLSWAFDKVMAGKFAEEGIPITHLGVLVTTDAKRRISKPDLIEECWITRWETFKANRDGEFKFTEKGPATQWLLGFNFFKRKAVDVPDEVKIKSMSVASR